MSTILIFLGGILFLAGILFIKPRAKQDKTWKTVAVWVLYVIFFLVASTGVSFVYINASVGHIVATSTAIFLFGGIALVLAVILARVLGLIKIITKKKVDDSLQA